MQVRNNYALQVMNGEIGMVLGMGGDPPELQVDFGDRVVCFERKDAFDLTLAYATTIHKAQGSEYPVVLVPVHSVTDLSELGPHVERELALVKVAGTGEKRVEALRLADIFRARPVDTTTQSFVLEISGSTQKVDQFIELMREVGLVEVARGGVVALSRGATAA
jgi:hypothetical protein